MLLRKNKSTFKGSDSQPTDREESGNKASGHDAEVNEPGDNIKAVWQYTV